MQERVVPFREAAEPIRLAVKRMVEKREEQRAFVIVDVVLDDAFVRGAFVQFACRDGKPLFDVPQLSIVTEPCTVDGSPALALDHLLRLGVSPDDGLRITEDETNRPKKESLLARLWHTLWCEA